MCLSFLGRGRERGEPREEEGGEKKMSYNDNSDFEFKGIVELLILNFRSAPEGRNKV